MIGSSLLAKNYVVFVGTGISREIDNQSIKKKMHVVFEHCREKDENECTTRIAKFQIPIGGVC